MSIYKRMSDNISTSSSQAFQGLNRDFIMKIIWCYSEILCPCWDKLKRFIAFSIAVMPWKTLSCTSLLIICPSHTIMFSFLRAAVQHTEWAMARVKISLCFYLVAAVKNCSVTAAIVKTYENDKTQKTLHILPLLCCTVKHKWNALKIVDILLVICSFLT